MATRTWTVVYTVNGERYRGPSGLRSMLVATLNAYRAKGFNAWLEEN